MNLSRYCQRGCCMWRLCSFEYFRSSLGSCGRLWSKSLFLLNIVLEFLKRARIRVFLVPRRLVFKTVSEACERSKLTYRTYKQIVSNLSWVHQLILNKLLENTGYQCIWWTNLFREIVKMSHKNDSHAIFIILRNIHVGNRIESSPS